MNSQTPPAPPALPGQNDQVNKTLALLRRQYPAAADQFINEVQSGRIAANEVALRLHQFVTALQRQPQAAQQASAAAATATAAAAAGQTSTPTPPAGAAPAASAGAGGDARAAAATPGASPAPASSARPLGHATTPQQQALARNIQSHGDALKRLQSMGSQLQAQCTTLQAKLNELNENPGKAGPDEKAQTETRLADSQKQWVQCKRKFDYHHQVYQQAKQQYLALTSRASTSASTPTATPSTSSPAAAAAAASAPTPAPAATTPVPGSTSTPAPAAAAAPTPGTNATATAAAAAAAATTAAAAAGSPPAAAGGAVPSPRPAALPTTSAGANLSLPAAVRSGTPSHATPAATAATAASPPAGSAASAGAPSAKPAVPATAARTGSVVATSGAGTPSLAGGGAGQSPAYLTSAPIPSTLQVTASQTTAAQPYPNARGARPTLNQGLAGGPVLAAPPTLQRPNVLPSNGAGATSGAGDKPASDWESLLGLPSGGKASAGKVPLQDDVDVSDDELVLASGGPNAAANLRTHGRLVSKRRIQSLVGDLAPGENLEGEVEDLLLELADEFIESTTRLACRLAKHRRSDRLEVRDVQLHLERNWNLRVPFPGSNPIAPPRPRGPAAQGGQK